MEAAALGPQREQKRSGQVLQQTEVGRVSQRQEAGAAKFSKLNRGWGRQVLNAMEGQSDRRGV
jgi:hypothetical protein